MSARNQKLQIVLSARAQVAAGELTAEQALTRIVWEMLEPFERRVLGYVIQMQTVTAMQVAIKFQITLGYASTELKLLFDNGLLERTERIDDNGRYFLYTPTKGIGDV